jgi:hypothetical protein
VVFEDGLSRLHDYKLAKRSVLFGVLKLGIKYDFRLLMSEET